MIEIHNTEVSGWEAAVRGMRNPMNSWEKSDSHWYTEINTDPVYYVGDNDLSLMKKLIAAGTDHSKFMRMINVTADVTAPLYWISEFDTYKVGTVRNSCSFMHKGVSKPFEISDFSIHDERVYEILSPMRINKSPLIYKYDTDEYKIYECSNGRKYRIYKNGKVISEPFECVDVTDRHRHFEERECIPSINPSGYYEINIGGRNGERWLLHRLVATVWLANEHNYATVNHIDGNKGNNCVENLEWCSLTDNIKHGFQNELYDNISSLHSKYIRWKNGHTVVDPWVKAEIIRDHKVNKLTIRQLSKKYDISESQANNMVSVNPCSENDLFLLCYTWENTINTLNTLRSIYIETKDNNIFQQIRCLLPCGYNQKFTVQLNYAVLRNIYHSRKDHKLDEWKQFCSWIEELPYYELITE